MRNTTRLILCALFAALIAVGAFLKIPIPNVPVTLQTLFVLLAGMLLGGKGGAIACLVYLAVGLIGIPVFTEGGGLMYLIKPTFGCLLGFAGCAFAAGTLTERMQPLSFLKLFGAGLSGVLVIYVVGAVHLFLVQDLYVSRGASFLVVSLTSMAMCIPVDVISCAVCALIVKKVRGHIKIRS